MKESSYMGALSQSLRTPSGIKEFFETCTQIDVLIENDEAVGFNIYADGHRFTYYLCGYERLELFEDNYYGFCSFTEDSCLRRFLLALLQTIDIKEKTVKAR